MALPESHPLRPARREWLRQWLARASADPNLVALGERARATISRRLAELYANTEAQAAQHASQRADAILASHEARVTTFLQVAYRKVARLDEYGDENPDALFDEIARVVLKLAETEPDLIEE